MPIKLYFDNHIPKAVAAQLRLRGIDVVGCEEVEMAASDDVEHLEYATSESRTLVTHDRDFVELHWKWLGDGLHHAGIVVFDRQLQGNIGRIVNELYQLHQLIDIGAGELHQDVFNHLFEFR